MTRQKHFGADGEVKFLPHRNVYIGFWGGRVVATRDNEAAVRRYIERLAKTPAVTKRTDVRTTLRTQVVNVWTSATTVYPALSNFPLPNVDFFSRGTTAGRAYYLEHKVTFNEVLAEENPDSFNNTVIHECAHLITNRLFPRANAHGPEFKMVMRRLGGDGERCHTYDVSSVKVTKTKKRYVYSCGCRDHGLTSQKHKKITMFGMKYNCRLCRNVISYTGKIRTF